MFYKKYLNNKYKMNYQGFATYENIPPQYGREPSGFYDRGSGVPQLNEFNTTVQDIYRTPFLFLQEHRQNFKDKVNVALKGIQCESELSKLFFSDANIKRIQRMIRNEVFRRTRGNFRLDVDQELSDLFIVMRAIYLEHARFLPNEVVRQTKRMNQKVVDDSVPSIITEIKQYYGYLKEINKPLSPIPRPINANNAGRKNLPSVTTTYGF